MQIVGIPNGIISASMFSFICITLTAFTLYCGCQSAVYVLVAGSKTVPSLPGRDCPTTHNRPGCNPEGGCFARRVLEAERDFQDQKGRLQEEVEALGHRVLFYPKFHCKLNFIERYWCRAKWFARENCGHDFEALKTTVPEALASVTNASIRGFYRLAVHH